MNSNRPLPGPAGRSASAGPESESMECGSPSARACEGLVVREAELEEILPLRAAVIVAGTDRDSPYFPGDEDETTRHFGAFEGSEPIGCLTFLRNAFEGRPAFQLRGMATRPDRQRAGVGRRLLAEAERLLLRGSDDAPLWCNARTGAVGFYEKTGWRVVSPEFLVEGVGPHVRMLKALGPASDPSTEASTTVVPRERATASESERGPAAREET